MVAPGLHYELFESPTFKARCKDLPELVIAVEAHVRRHFDRLEKLDADTRLGELNYQGQCFGFAVISLGRSRLALQQIWNAELEQINVITLRSAQRLRNKK